MDKAISLLKVLYLDEVTSTQDAAIQIVQNNQTEYGAIRANFQSVGRGRWGKNWLSDKGHNLMVTYIDWEHKNPHKPWELGFLMGLSVCTAIEKTIDDVSMQKPLLRWPNDIIIENKKIAGVLVELAKTNCHDRIPLVGVGINVNSLPIVLPILQPTTSLLMLTNQEYSIEKLMYVVWNQFCTLAEDYALDSSALWKHWEHRDGTKGKRYFNSDGRRGIAQGVTREGLLILNWDDGGKDLLPAAEILIT